jgi:hypothetical protein
VSGRYQASRAERPVRHSPPHRRNDSAPDVPPGNKIGCMRVKAPQGNLDYCMSGVPADRRTAAPIPCRGRAGNRRFAARARPDTGRGEDRAPSRAVRDHRAGVPPHPPPD